MKIINHKSEMINEIECPKCYAVLPATTEFWHRSPLYKSGLYEAACKKCRNKARVLRRHKEREMEGKPVRRYGCGPGNIQSTKDRRRPEVPFEDKCLEDHVKRASAPILSIDR